MAGRRNWLLIVGLLAGGLFVTPHQAAQAQGYAQSQGGITIRKDALEKATWYVAPREYQIIDNRPSIRDFRSPPEEGGTVTIPVGPVGGGARNANGASIPGDGIRIGTPQVRFVGNDLPQAALGSNINESRLKPRGLPSGRSTNRLADKQVKGQPALAAHPGKQLVGDRPVVASRPQTKLLTYAPSQPSATGSGHSRLSTSTSVIGVIKHGSLLGK